MNIFPISKLFAIYSSVEELHINTIEIAQLNTIVMNKDSLYYDPHILVIKSENKI
jgi:hypothetical protein